MLFRSNIEENKHYNPKVDKHIRFAELSDETIDEIISKLEYAEHKQDQVEILMKRIIGRAFMTGRELRTFRGILNRINKRIKNSYEE